MKRKVKKRLSREGKLRASSVSSNTSYSSTNSNNSNHSNSNPHNNRTPISGSIKRVFLKDFLTYTSVEITPYDGLNIIIGPNGVGKSTFIAALMIGLSAKTSNIGRAKKIGEYVKTGRTEATIEIELYVEKGTSSVKITHVFNVDNRSVWSIDDVVTSAKHVDELVDSLNINVDNLCQILPQERVHDFAKLTPQTLLRDTQKALGDMEASKLLEDLCEQKNNKKKIVSTLSNNKKTVEEFKTLNARIQGDIEKMNQVKKMRKQYEICEKKKLWLEYDDLKNDCDKREKEKSKVLNKIKKQEKEMEPYEQERLSVLQEIASIESNISALNPTTTNLKTKFRNLTGQFRSQDDLIEQSKSDFETKKQNAQNHRQNIERAELVLSKLQNDKVTLENSFKSDSTIENQIQIVNSSLEQEISVVGPLKTEVDKLERDLTQIKFNSKIQRDRLEELKNIKNKRLRFLQERQKDTYEAVMWLRDNINLFHGNVYEPMLLELNFRDPKYAIYLENTISLRDMIAFTFESVKDMNLFMTNVRRLNLKLVNTVCSPPINEVYSPPIPIQQLKQFGFSIYLVDAVTGPEAIINFLCKNYHIHRIPIGNDFTYKNSESVPSQINFFYSEKHRFNISISRYSGEKSTGSFEIREPKLFTNNVDSNVMDQLVERISNIQIDEARKRKNLEELNAKLKNVEKKVSEHLHNKQKLHNHLNQLKGLSSRIQLQIRELANFRGQVIDLNAEEMLLNNRINDCVQRKNDIAKKIDAVLKDYRNCNIQSKNYHTKIDSSRRYLSDKKNAMAVQENKLRNLKEALEEVNVQLEEITNNAKDKLQEAKAATGNFMITDRNFPLKTQFSLLPDDNTELFEHMVGLKTKIDTSHKMDANLIQEFEEREKQIVILERHNSEFEEQVTQIDSAITTLKNEWLVPLELKISKINESFSEMFSEMGFAGEVRLHKYGEEEDFNQYGIDIMVKFRDDTQLKQLDMYVQSGGERALSIAIYLMALQMQSKVPFRCVDEINQGMDPVNERKMMEILFKITKSHQNQYFLLTPKLLSDLSYSLKGRVHVIVNGSGIPRYDTWGSKILIALYTNQFVIENTKYLLNKTDS